MLRAEDTPQVDPVRQGASQRVQEFGSGPHQIRQDGSRHKLEGSDRLLAVEPMPGVLTVKTKAIVSKSGNAIRPEVDWLTIVFQQTVMLQRQGFVVPCRARPRPCRPCNLAPCCLLHVLAQHS